MIQAIQESNGKPSECTEFEDILEIVGGYGKYQKRMILFFLIPTSIILPFMCMNVIFLVSIPDHWCRDSSLDAFNMTFHEKQQLLRPIVMQEGKLGPSKCDVVDYREVLLNGSATDFGSLRNISKNMPTKKCSRGWEYDQSLYASTAASKWDLVCDNDQLPTLVFTLGSVGSAIGTPLYGALSDKYGRKPIFMVTIVVAVLTTGLSVAMPLVILFMIIRGINGTAMPCAFQLPYLILLEIIGPDMRARINGISCVAWTFGLALMPLVAYLTADWIIFGWVCFAVLLPYIGYYWYLPESSRWLICKKRYEEAAKILTKVAHTNGKAVSEEYILANVKKLGEYDAIKSTDESSTPLDLVRYPMIRQRFIIVCISWISNSVSYYAFHINVTNLYGNEFMNFFLLAIVELPSYITAWYVVQTRLGRRWCNVMFTLLMAAACFTPVLVPAEQQGWTTFASLVGKFGNCASFLAMYQQASELLPTGIRASGMGIASTVSSLFSIGAPYVIYLGEYGRHIPFTVMATIAFIAGVSAAFLPETLNEYLPQVAKDAETFGRRKKFFCLAKRKLEKNEDIIDVEVSMEKIGSVNNCVN